MSSAHGSSSSRRLAFSGTWYSGDPELLAGEVDGMLASASEPAVPALAVVAPHAGLRYSGHVAAWSYRALGAAARDLIVLVGPSHHVQFPGCAILTRGALDTPWDPLPVAEREADALGKALTIPHEPHTEIHEQEHSLELQLPFLARVQPGVPVLPILVGRQTRETAIALADAIVDALGGVNLALVASSDLSHYLPATKAYAMDRLVLGALDQADPDALLDVLDRDPHHACGGGPMAAVLSAAKRLGATAGGVLRYADSGDVTGDKSSVVGYVSAAFSRPR